jgi:hypothetical protein
LDVTSNDLPNGFDVVSCSLFLHHLSREQAVELLRKMSRSGRLLVASDLRRCRAGYVLAHLACRVLSRSPIVRWDGPRSVANAFSLTEMKDVCSEAGLFNAKIGPSWPCRMLIVHSARPSS